MSNGAELLALSRRWAEKRLSGIGEGGGRKSVCPPLIGRGMSIDSQETVPLSASELELPRCRFCSAPLRETFVDLGLSPLCESYVSAERLSSMEPFYPLHARVCEQCLLVQLEEFVTSEDIFSEYAYFSSYSDSWVAHTRDYVAMATERFGLGPDSVVIEVASNDGYLLQHVSERGIPALGIEPAANVAAAARERGIKTVVEFFGRELAGRLVADGWQANLLVANNVMAHVPDLNDFVGGMEPLLAPGGAVTIEVPHLVRLVEGNQFDTIYHEHFSYFTLLTASKVLAAHGLELFDVEELKSHGGSLRLYAQRREEKPHAVSSRVAALAEYERALGYDTLEGHRGFSARVVETKWRLLEFLIDARRAGKRVAGYGAPGKGNTLLNYCGIRTDLLGFTVDRNPYKQGQFLPGTRIPIRHPDALEHARPEYILILPWNLRDEIVAQLSDARRWGAQFVVPIPGVEVL
jgi:C-methyltransferase C-terminal domain/Putative zinc binding domain/Methyltransferase domain